MPNIKVLPQHLADKIAAGEVAERPASVVKELIENSIDAGSDKITVEIKNGGVTYIRITDNGCGIDKDEVELAFFRHATSKIRNEDDLYRISTMGFRGEALASICAVSDIQVITKTKDTEAGVFMQMKAGSVAERYDIACTEGTSLIVENLFSNVPARMKFLKKDAMEAGYVADVIARTAMSNPRISFLYICDEKEVFFTTGDGDIRNAVLSIYGRECAKALIDVEYEEENIKISGIVGTPDIARGNRARETIFVNGRYIKNFVVAKVVEDAYRNILMTGKFPFFVLNIDIPYDTVDVNVHPAKTEIKFADEKYVYDNMYKAIKNVLYTTCVIPQPLSSLDDEADNEAISKLVDQSFSKAAVTGNAVALPNVTFADVNPAVSASGGDELSFSNYAVREPELLVRYDTQVGRAVSAYGGGGGGGGALSEQEEAKAQLDSMLDTDSVPQNNNFERKFWFDGMSSADGIFAKRRIIGQLFNTYILVEKEGALFLIDQHAAHERLNYERIMESYRQNESMGQMLLVPIVMELDSVEKSFVMENMEHFKQFGFGIEEFGESALLIEQVPVEGKEQDIKELILEIIDTLSRGHKLSLAEVESKIVYSIACKSAIKANKRLTFEEVERLIDLLDDMENINTCPHGRPIQISFTKYNIEKMFKRIV